MHNIFVHIACIIIYVNVYVYLVKANYKVRSVPHHHQHIVNSVQLEAVLQKNAHFNSILRSTEAIRRSSCLIRYCMEKL